MSQYADSPAMQKHRAQVAQNNPEAARVMEIRDHAQEIACREAGEIVRWQQVEVAADALIDAAGRYIADVLPVPRSSGQNASDRSDAFSQVENLLLETIAHIRWPQAEISRKKVDDLVDDLAQEMESRVGKKALETRRLARRVEERDPAQYDDKSERRAVTADDVETILTNLPDEHWDEILSNRKLRAVERKLDGDNGIPSLIKGRFNTGTKP
jgi:hypothetical protein